MPFVPDMLATIRNLAGKAADFVKILPEKIFHRKILFIGLGAVLFILLVLIVCFITVVILMNRIPDSPAPGTEALSGALQPGDLRPQIPLEDLFFPEEPDFLPDVIPERERRDFWTAGDAEPFWYNPLDEGEKQWRDRIESVIDELLEQAP
jgi:hypothetical protein